MTAKQKVFTFQIRQNYNGQSLEESTPLCAGKASQCSRNEFEEVQIANVVEGCFPTMLAMFSNGLSRKDVHWPFILDDWQASSPNKQRERRKLTKTTEAQRPQPTLISILDKTDYLGEWVKHRCSCLILICCKGNILNYISCFVICFGSMPLETSITDNEITCANS